MLKTFKYLIRQRCITAIAHTCDKVAFGRRRRRRRLLLVMLLVLLLLIVLLILVMRPLLLLVPRVRLLVLTHVSEAAVRAHARVPRPHETGNAETVRDTRREFNTRHTPLAI